MKTRILDVTRRGALFAALIPAAVALPLVSGCAAEEPETATASQGLGEACTILRPVGWSGAAAACHEGSIPPGSPPIVFMLPSGDSATFHSVPGPGMGVGEVTFICQNGNLTVDPWDDICIPNRGGGGGEEP
ncbi:MAG TPA: hypothetical protein VHT91_19820 [Kofleriaceae bacterium]|jgi:hypothetical protein|nr:hypothetical protein [Kofleriaceae bacterium]